MIKRIINLIIVTAILLPTFAHSAAYETYIDRRNGSNSQTVPLTVPVPIADAIYYYDKANFWPRLVLIGPSLRISGGYINCVQPTLLSQLTNDVGFLTSLPYHTHDADDVTTGVFSDFRIPALEITKINGLQDALDSKVSTGDSVPWSAVTGFTGVTSVNSTTGAVTLSYGDVGAAAASHTHTASQVTGFDDAVDARVSAGISSDIRRTRAQTDTNGAYTWTFPTAFGSGITPIVSVTVEDGSSAIWNTQITSISNTSVTVQLTKTTAVTVLGVSVLGVAATPQAYVHLTAIAP